MKACARCGNDKEEKHFHKMASTADGLRPECKECRKSSSYYVGPPRARGTCKDCGGPVYHASAKQCRSCMLVITEDSFTSTDRHGYSYCSRNGKRLTAHRWQMEQMLGRELLPGENVHHKNGVRNDNRPENLELWVTTQPKGQRPEDLVEWAREILDKYASLVLAV